MDHLRIYHLLIERAKWRRGLDCYSEWHHIHPRSLGGGDEKENLVQLTYREHFLAHWLLTKLFHGKARRSMVFAFLAMGMDPIGQGVVASWRFEILKKAVKDRIHDKQLRQAVRELEVERIKQRRLYGVDFPLLEKKKIGEACKVINGRHKYVPVFGIDKDGMDLIAKMPLRRNSGRLHKEALADATKRILKASCSPVYRIRNKDRRRR